MAQKTIGELELKASILTTDNVVVDDGTNSYKATVAQLATAVLPAQTSNNFKALQTNGSTTFWGDLNTGALCSTAAATAAKTVSFTNFVLSDFCRVIIKFSNANTATSPTLNVNGTGDKPIKINGSTATNITWEAGTIVDFIYDGENWVCRTNRIGIDWASGVTKDYAGFTAESDGWIKCEGYSDLGYVRVYVNGDFTTIADSTGARIYASQWIRVLKGDICSMGNTTGSAMTKFIFYSDKAVL